MIPAPEQWPAISQHVWATKYRWAGEADIHATWRRVARAVASVERSDQEGWTERFAELLSGFGFLPGGRILAGAGTTRRTTLFNCFVMGVIDDTLEGIFEALKQGAQTMQSGGGVGYDFSTLRPQGSLARASGSIASGPVSFMRIWDAMCATMLSTGARRGAMMATLRCDHPDIELFVDAKRDPAALRHFNLSVQVTDEFMAAIETDAEWPLVFPLHGHPPEAAQRVLRRSWTGTPHPVDCGVVRVLRARDLWAHIIRAAYDSAEPGVLFVDQINRENNLHDREQISATNPCGEIPLPPFGACNLGSLNLAAFVIDPFEPGARLDYERLDAASRRAIRFLDNVIDLSIFPVPAQAVNARATRRIGLGITGLADALAMLGQRYDGWTARGLAEDVMRRICRAAYSASIDLATERGAFPSFESPAFLASRFVTRLPADLRDAIGRRGIRNSHLLAIAPAGTISLLAGNVSSGIEPIFAAESERRILEADGRYRVYQVEDFAWALWRSRFPRRAPPASLLSAYEIDPRAHLEMQAALQPWVDNAISKTINVPASMPFDEFTGLYEMAHRRGLKGCTVFRPTALRGEVIAVALPQEPVHCCDPEREAD
jgi:ribonucleoside-diphosphate reductase alpha chain